ncbi:ABC transporter permease [Amylibacter kogurei]|uniref:ABC transporter permease n=1 Tax=Paramylibacter kogurei TaxID=1889778 RepID=A0A2G5K525_9RHOB|nr:EamA family transporter [Amylibacter kogurei]PIB23980.1 ABC transporter permease [Amylibacter kogurei]
MTKPLDLMLTAIAPIIWGSTYIVTTEFLPAGYPLTVAMLRALPAGLLILLLVRQLPRGIWWGRMFILGALNFAIFWGMLFIAAYRLPGGVAATVGAIQPLIIIFLMRAIFGNQVRPTAIFASLLGIVGVAFLILGPSATLDPIGILAGLAGAISMALGTVLTRKWQPPVSLLTFTAWQLSSGGIILLPIALFFEPALPALTLRNMFGFAYLGLIGAALTYVLWFRGISRISPNIVSSLGYLSPLAAVLLGWWFLEQALSIIQIFGIIIIVISLQIATRTQKTPATS